MIQLVARQSENQLEFHANADEYNASNMLELMIQWKGRYVHINDIVFQLRVSWEPFQLRVQWQSIVKLERKWPSLIFPRRPLKQISEENYTVDVIQYIVDCQGQSLLSQAKKRQIVCDVTLRQTRTSLEQVSSGEQIITSMGRRLGRPTSINSRWLSVPKRRPTTTAVQQWRLFRSETASSSAYRRCNCYSNPTGSWLMPSQKASEKSTVFWRRASCSSSPEYWPTLNFSIWPCYDL